ncbi:undecaprenyl-diphosphate phosphatase [Criibacterium bergeronii]|uniref:Undecaprenyl-diphosphatase n=1 Tax=Criibacterium bergeronii TaxID=1871336 RepID=A0A552VCU9_9FIRM|nr:undecaprenyl-diphosphate phosphatase [Criibacterium bergeronii]TRW28301.1 undecaprenyl-diphosphate phosphatase [Criibacterium bergeronii]
MIDILKVILLSFVEGLTEFLPISSTGHLILVNEFIKLEPESFANIFSIIIQLGAIMSVVVLYFSRLNPFSKEKKEAQKKETLRTWGLVIVGVLPAVILGLKFDDFIDAHLMNSYVVAAMLFIWGIGIILLEKMNKKATIINLSGMSYKTAFLIGIAQCFAMIPGTSRSAATIIGAMLLGCNRKVAAEFSFFLAIPTMFGATLLKVVKIFVKGIPITGFEVFLIVLGMVLSFIVALVVIKKFMRYIKEHDFVPFGIYRIVLAVIVVIYFIVK